MIRKKLIKSLSLALATMLAIMTVACGAKENDSAADTANAEISTTAEEDKLTDSLANSIGSSDDAGKVETVYVNADASGATNDIIVSEWLKNDGSAEIADKTELKDIVNVKGDETFKDNGDGTLTWNAKGSDIYYQGVTDKKLPVNMKITYTLDGKEIKPEDLAGKSGKVTIRFEYENTDKQTVDVDGKEIDVFTPFVMMSGMKLDGDKFSNVEVSNGKVISDGGNFIVMGVAVPGLKDSLDISEDKWEELDDEELEKKLDNSFEISADTTDFELGMTITMASSDILSDFGMSDLSGSDKIDDLKDNMDKLNDGSSALVDGSKELKNGTGELRNGVSDLYDGTKEFKDGTKELLNGTGKLSGGMKDFYSGIVKYTNGAHDLRNGTAALEEGITAAKDGSSTLRKGMEDAKLVENANALAKGTETMDNGVKQMARMASSLSDLISASSKLSDIKNAYLATQSYLLGSGDPTQGAIACQTLGVDKNTLDAVIATGKPALSAVNPGSVAPVTFESMLVLTADFGELNHGDNSGDGNEAGGDDKGSTDGNAGSGSDNAGNSGDNGGNAGGSGSGSDNGGNAGESGAGSDNGGNTNGAGTGSDNGGSSSGAGTVTDNGGNAGGNNAGNTNSGNSGNAGSNGAGAGADTNSGNAGGNPATANNTTGNNTASNAGGAAAQNGAGSVAATAGNEGGSQVSADALTSNMSTTSLNLNGAGNGAIDPAILGTSHIVTLDGKQYYTKEELDAAVQQAIEKTKEEVIKKAEEEGAQKTMLIASYSGYLAQTKAVLTFIKQAHLDVLANLDPETLNKLSQLDTLVAGADQIANGNAKLAEGIEKIYGGTVQLDQGIGKLKDGSTELRKGADKLTDNNKAIVDGATKLCDGTSELNDGAGKLDDGAGELGDGVGKLFDGVGQLDDGVKELVDGVVKFDEEGIKKIYEAFDGDLSDFSDRLSAIEKAGENYSTFGGASDDIDSSVKFIIKTDGIKSDNA